MVLLEEYNSTDYLDFVEFIALMNDRKGKIDIDNIPQFTTLKIIIYKILFALFNFILSGNPKLFYSMGENIAGTPIDTTDFSTSYTSYYHSRRTGDFRRNCLKISISVDTNNKLTLGW